MHSRIIKKWGKHSKRAVRRTVLADSLTSSSAGWFRMRWNRNNVPILLLILLLVGTTAENSTPMQDITIFSVERGIAVVSGGTTQSPFADEEHLRSNPLASERLLAMFAVRDHHFSCQNKYRKSCISIQTSHACIYPHSRVHNRFPGSRHGCDLRRG